jgi:hypothetical protein
MSVLSGISAIQVQSVASTPAPAAVSAAPAPDDTTDTTTAIAPPPVAAPSNQSTPAPAPTDTTDNTPPVAAIYTAVADVNAPTILGTNVNITA